MAHIAIVDAEATAATPLALALGQAGHTTQLIHDGAEALAVLRETMPAAIVLSVELPQVSGYSLCNKIKRDPQLSAVPLLLVSNQATAETFEEHKRLRTRADAYGHKPYDIAAMLETLAGLLGEPSIVVPSPAPDAKPTIADPAPPASRAVRFGEDPSVRDISSSPFLQGEEQAGDTAVFGEGELEAAARSGDSGGGGSSSSSDDAFREEQAWVEQALQGRATDPSPTSDAPHADEPSDAGVPEDTGHANAPADPDDAAPRLAEAETDAAMQAQDADHGAEAQAFPLHTAPFEPTPVPAPAPAAPDAPPDAPPEGPAASDEALVGRDTRVDPPKPKRRSSRKPTAKQAKVADSAEDAPAPAQGESAALAALQQQIASLEQDLARAYAHAPSEQTGDIRAHLDALDSQVSALADGLAAALRAQQDIAAQLQQWRQRLEG